VNLDLTKRVMDSNIAIPKIKLPILSPNSPNTIIPKINKLRMKIPVLVEIIGSLNIIGEAIKNMITIAKITKMAINEVENPY
jgi:hypothetical protein